MGDPSTEPHLGDELGLAEGTHGAPQHPGPVQQRHLAVGIVGCSIRVHHLLDLRDEDITRHSNVIYLFSCPTAKWL